MKKRRPGRAVVLVSTFVGVLWIAGIMVAVSPRVAPEWPEWIPLGGTASMGTLHALGDPRTSGLSTPPGFFDAAPVAYDINGNGRKEIIAHSNDTNVYVFDTATGRALATIPTRYPPVWGIDHILKPPAVAVLRPGEPPSIVITNHAAFVSVWRYVPDGSTPDHFEFERMWETRMNDCYWDSGMDAAALLADADGDGALEIFVQTEEIGLFALSADGSTLWHHCWAGGNAAPVADDLNGDGSLEVIYASDSGFLSVFNAATGHPLWTFDARSAPYGIRPGSIPVSPVTAELDGVPPREVLFTARYVPSADPARYDTFNMAIFAVHQSPVTWKGEALWMRQPEWAHPMSYTHLVVEDVDGDGCPDIFGMDWNTIGHHPGNWEPLGPAHLFRLDADGNDVWVKEVDSWWSNKDIAIIGPLAGGGHEILANGEKEGVDGLWRLSASDGKLKGFVSAGPWKVMRGPVLVDLRGDGQQQIMFPVVPDEERPTRGLILVFELSKIR